MSTTLKAKQGGDHAGHSLALGARFLEVAGTQKEEMKVTVPTFTYIFKGQIIKRIEETVKEKKKNLSQMRKGRRKLTEGVRPLLSMTHH